MDIVNSLSVSSFSVRLHDDCKALQTEISDLKKQIVRRRKRLRSLRPKLKQVVKVRRIPSSNYSLISRSL